MAMFRQMKPFIWLLLLLAGGIFALGGLRHVRPETGLGLLSETNRGLLEMGVGVVVIVVGAYLSPLNRNRDDI